MFHVKHLRGQHHDKAMWLLAFRFAAESCSSNRVVNDLALERCHWLHLDRLAGLLDRFRRGGPLGRQRGALCLAPAPDVEHKSAPLTGLAQDSQPRELLDGVKDLALVPHEVLEIAADERHEGTLAFDIHVDISVEVGDVHQLLEVIGSHIALALEGFPADGDWAGGYWAGGCVSDRSVSDRSVSDRLVDAHACSSCGGSPEVGSPAVPLRCD